MRISELIRSLIYKRGSKADVKPGGVNAKMVPKAGLKGFQ